MSPGQVAPADSYCFYSTQPEKLIGQIMEKKKKKGV